MTARFLQTVFTPSVKAAQTAFGSRLPYSRFDGGPTEPDVLSEQESSFISARDSFYLATTMENGWPYLQHRGGPPGFVKVLDERTLGFADYRGNRQYVSVGNASVDDRAALFFMDYAGRARLKLLGRLRITTIDENPILTRAIISSHDKATVERIILIDIEAFDWNCPQHITPRFSADEVLAVTDALKARIAVLEKELAQLR